MSNSRYLKNFSFAKPGVLVATIIVLAAVLRFLGLSHYALNGDEYNSINEARQVGLNLNGILYLSFMHFWLKGGIQEFWLRYPSAVFGVLTVPLMYQLGVTLGNRKTGVVAAALLALSPFHIFHSQEVRFYPFFILATVLFLYTSARYLKSKTKQRLITLLVATAMVLPSHFLSFFVIGGQTLVCLIAGGSRKSQATRTLIAVLIISVLFILPLLPAVNQPLWQFYQTHANHTGTKEILFTNISPLSFVKIIFAGYIFLLGYHLYPLWLIFVIPALLLFLVILLSGTIRMWRSTRWASLVLIYGTILVGVYVVLDAVGGRLASGVAPRHVSFLLPVVLLISAFGLARFKKHIFWVLLTLVTFINLGALWPRWTSQPWVYATLIDYRKAGTIVETWLDTNTAVVYDGRSSDALSFYFPEGAPYWGYWPYLEGENWEELNTYHRLIFVTNDYQADRRSGFNTIFTRLAENYYWQSSYVDYPLTVTVWEQKREALPGYPVSETTGQVHLPLEAYGLEFQDLEIPITITTSNDIQLDVVGSFAVSSVEGDHQMVIPLQSTFPSQGMLILNNVTNADALKQGEQIAEVVLVTALQEQITHPIRFGIETTSWDDECNMNALCDTLFQWHKYVALTGQQSYPGAWRDFQAGLHSTLIDFPLPQNIVEVKVNYLANSGAWYIWGIDLLRED